METLKNILTFWLEQNKLSKLALPKLKSFEDNDQLGVDFCSQISSGKLIQLTQGISLQNK